MRKLTKPGARQAPRPESDGPGCRARKMNGTLVMDCQGCSGGQSLDSPQCFRGVVKALSRESGVNEILLSRDWEISYGEDCVRALEGLSDVVKFLSSVQFHDAFEDCASCRCSPRAIIPGLIESLPSSDPGWAAASLQRGPHGKACGGCVRSLKADLEHAANLMSEAERRVCWTAFRVVAVNG